MTVGFVMLVHEPLDRAAQVARHWARAGCPVVIHVDKRVRKPAFQRFATQLAEYDSIAFADRHSCDWGTWSLVDASQTAAQLMLDRFPDVNHVFLASGSCLPLRPVGELRAYLLSNLNTDFIESVTTRDVPWTTGGLDHERFWYSFPFSWKRQRFLFDRFVSLQKMVGRRRRLPRGIVPHLGSQWWCLTRRTLTKILNDPRRREFERYFRRVWIPDESYYQTLVREHSRHIESRSLTLSKFDFQGKPHIFYDDHLQLLRRSDCFVARKVWPRADRLYSSFLDHDIHLTQRAAPNAAQIDRVFAQAVDRRTRGRPGLYMHSRFPNWDWENGKTAAPYSVLSGFGALFEDFEDWMSRNGACRAHGRLFAPDRAHFADGAQMYAGALSDSAALRDYNPRAFLTNLLWNTRGERQCFGFSPADNQKIAGFIAADPNAQISVVSGAWAVPLFQSSRDFATVRDQAAKLQKVETKFLKILRQPQTRARVRIWSLSEFLESPVEPLQVILDEIGHRDGRRLTEVPRLVRLRGFARFLQNLKNEGMHPHLIGEFPIAEYGDPHQRPERRPYAAE
ncbi:MAG: beta-1,6-N-acetylglucosaminyltransferase [Pseudomonadota bacterium]